MSFPLQSAEWVGYFAACLTTASFVPQAWMTFKTRDVRSISLAMYSVFTLGVALWLAYGLLVSAWPVVLANSVTLALAASILTMKLKYRQRTVTQANTSAPVNGRTSD
jgi:MtN3 and saliva related transmembrane protein